MSAPTLSISQKKKPKRNARWWARKAQYQAERRARTQQPVRPPEQQTADLEEAPDSADGVPKPKRRKTQQSVRKVSIHQTGNPFYNGLSHAEGSTSVSNSEDEWNGFPDEESPHSEDDVDEPNESPSSVRLSGGSHNGSSNDDQASSSEESSPSDADEHDDSPPGVTSRRTAITGSVVVSVVVSVVGRGDAWVVIDGMGSW